MRSNGSGIRWDTREMQADLATLPVRLDAGLAALTEFWAPQVEAQARSSAPWKDQTSNARNGLTARAVHEPLRSHSIVLFHTVPYGIWLEVRWSGRYAVILPTIERMGPEVFAHAESLLGRL